MLRTFHATLRLRREDLLRLGINLMLGLDYSVGGRPAIGFPRLGIECTVYSEILEELLT